MENRRSLLLALIATFALTHLVQAQDQEGFISLDCGLAPDRSPYNEQHTGLTFISDASFVQSGKSGTIAKELESNFLKPYLSLRYFPDGTRSCYNLNVTESTNYLIRTAFVYGNYDGQNTPPTFDLYLGPNKWETVYLQGKVNGTMEEIIHIPKSSSLQICLVKTGTTTPLISALELRPLRNITYVAQRGSLKLSFRLYLRNSGPYIRYPDDVHDRQWLPYFDDKDWTQINSTLNINVSNVFEPPEAAIAIGATPTNASAPLAFAWPFYYPTTKFYMYIYFAEIQALHINDTREFNIMSNGKLLYGPFSPTKLQIATIYTIIPAECDKANCRLFELLKTARSTLPPLLNAIEAFTEIEFLQAETNQSDVSAIKSIQETYGLNRISWQGDPCVPKAYLWDGLHCNDTDISVPPRIISLNLSSGGLTGIIAPKIQYLTQLQELDLSNNKLTGGVPDFLGNMKSLLVINLSGNDLSGSVPQTLLDKKSEGLLKLDIAGNTKLSCRSGSCENLGGSAGNNKKKLLAAVVASIASAITITVLVLFFLHKQKKATNAKVPRPSPAMQALDIQRFAYSERRFTYSEILAITNNFQRILGKGGFGFVYHGYVNDTKQVAIKMLSQSSAQGYKQFRAEVELLLRVHHKNLVSLVGYCDEGDNLALIYEYMANGDLKEHLSGKHGGSILSWVSRLKIAVEAAQGLEYLHHGCKPPIVHRDVKSTNILLDEHFKAKLADFGLSRSVPLGDESYVSTVVVGTPGYLDPEYYKTNRLTEKTDVYSFGIVLLEVIASRPVIDHACERPHITEWIEFLLQEGDVKSVMDPNLQGDYDSNSLSRAVELAMACVNASPAKRPTMSQVVNGLNECLASEYSRIRANQVTDSKEFSNDSRI